MVASTFKIAGAAALALAGTVVASPAPMARRADTSGCGNKHNSGFHGPNDAHSIQSSGQTRYYGIYVPDGYNDDTNRQRKVILDFHGRYGNPQKQYDNSRYETYDDGKEYLLVQPQGLNEAWQGASYAADGVNDLQFVTDLIAHLREEYCVDSDHIYASGKSNGGGFVDTLACSDNGDEIAAFAMASAALYTDNSEDSCSKKRAILESHGDQDQTIKYGGGSGAGGQTPNIDDWISWWAQRDGGSDADKQVDEEDGYRYTHYSINGLQDVVAHYEVYNLGHCWPASTGGNTDDQKPECHDYVLDFSGKVLEWFSKWDLNNAPKN